MHGRPLPIGEMRHECLVCGGEMSQSRTAGLLECRRCRFITANMVLSKEEHEALYGRNYFEGTTVYQDYAREADALRLNFDRRLATMAKIIPEFADKSLFEIGCAYGYFLERASEWVRSASGIDVSPEVVRIATERAQALSGDYLTTEVPPVDVIALWDTIEHLPRPDLFVEKAAHDLNPGGHLAITSGDIGSLNARFRGKKWRMIHPPTHLHYFSVVTLSRLLEHFGFDVVHVSHPGFARQARSVLHIILALKWRKPRLFDAVSRLPGLGVVFTINFFDIMFVVAKKR
jgi:SAM-dependent methyltransferase